MSEKLSRASFYPLADYHPAKFIDHKNIMARWNGEKRAPKKGEWYLSGSTIAAYQAKNDMTVPYHIAELCEVKTTTTIVKERI